MHKLRVFTLSMLALAAVVVWQTLSTPAVEAAPAQDAASKHGAVPRDSATLSAMNAP
ncbi:MAG TPA: hypothetical protein VE153_28965 [Myxococcus sp.]|jgi:hypothetical protein|nr:hypothetical protein [Myxococcus sp.]